jgi:hypothetical protein
MNDTMSYPKLSNSAEQMLKFSSPDVAACSPFPRSKGGSEGFPEPRLHLTMTLAAGGKNKESLRVRVSDTPP